MSDAVATFAGSANRAGLFLDFDGTLSEVVPIPSDARPIRGARETLARLAKRFALVAIVSGRSARELIGWLGEDVEIWGTHGAERAVAGEVEISDLAAPYHELLDRVEREARDDVIALDLRGAIVESKTAALVLHYRAAEDPERARVELERVTQTLARRHGLLWGEGRSSYELRAPVDFSKAAVVLKRARDEGLEAAAFIGDDTVDLPAFDALDDLADEGVSTLRVAVRSEESPSELLERADVVVDGPLAVLALLDELEQAAARS